MITYEENSITVDAYLALRETVGWRKLSREQAEKALKNSLHIICARQDGRLVGMGRLVGDGAVICYVQDLIVLPDVQRQGVGSCLLERLTRYARSIGFPDTTMMFALMCARGREAFYEHHGFIPRPTDTLGPGMIQYLSL